MDDLFRFSEPQMLLELNGMIVPGSTYWNIAFGSHSIDVMDDEEGVKTITAFAENLAWLLMKIKGT